MALVSVLVPVHNDGGFLPETVKSVLAQSCPDFELIVVDDGSTDGGTAFLAAIADKRLRVITQDQQGAPAALNTGLAAARGEFIAFLDHDDLWLPDKLQAHLDCFRAHADADLTFDWSRRIDEHGVDLGLPSHPWHGTISFEQLLQDFVVGNSSAIVVRREAIGRGGPLNPLLPRVYDLDLCLRISAQRCGNCRAVPRHLTLYRRHSGQMSRDWRKLREEWEYLLHRVPKYAPRAIDTLLPAADSNMRRYLAWIASEEGDFASAVKLQLSAFRRAPLRALPDSRNWLMLAAVTGGLLLPDGAYRKAVELGKRILR
jgi:glycosyltransferase involved in cell wall biosynthesis